MVQWLRPFLALRGSPRRDAGRRETAARAIEVTDIDYPFPGMDPYPAMKEKHVRTRRAGGDPFGRTNRLP